MCRPGARRDVGPGRPRHLDELLLDLALEVVAALLVEGVPLVVGDDEGAARVDDLLHDADVLLGDRLLGVDEHDGHLGLLEGGLGAQRRVEVGATALVDAAPDAGRVDEAPRLATELDELVDRVAGGAGDVVDDDPLVAGEAVEQARLADVGAPDERDPSRAALGVRAVGRHVGQHLEHGVEGVAAPAAVHGGHREGLAEAEAPQHRRVGLAALVVDLVGDEHDRLAGPAQQLDDRLVVVGRADGGVDDEHDDVGEVDGDLGLLGDAQVDAGGVRLPAAGVDDGEAAPAPLGLVGDPVTGHAGHVLDDGLAAAQDAVDQARLADVGAADHGDDGQRALGRAVVGERPLGVEQRLVLRAELEVVEPGAQGALHGGVVDGGVGGRDRSALVDGAGGLVSHGVLESVNVS